MKISIKIEYINDDEIKTVELVDFSNLAELKERINKIEKEEWYLKQLVVPF